MGTPNDNGPGTPSGTDDESTEAGSGKQFAKDVHSPGGPSSVPEGSGKQFRPSNRPSGGDEDEDDDDH
ncbi:MAG TPA: hypothetical protein VK891_08030 [Euzebyales bacterium]|nr:hypothetical protein [Euzebyales bacterium]